MVEVDLVRRSMVRDVVLRDLHAQVYPALSLLGVAESLLTLKLAIKKYVTFVKKKICV